MNNRCDVFNQAALQNEQQARQLCEKLCAEADGLPRLKTIAAVGAYDARIGGSGVDSQRLTGIFGYLLRSGVLIDPDFEIDVVNFREKRDFLREDKPADLVFASLILAQHHFRASYNYHERLHGIVETGRDYRGVFGTAISPINSISTWKDRMKNAGAKIVATYGGLMEIGTHHVCDVDQEATFKTLIASPERSMWDCVKRTDGDKDVGGFILETDAKISLSTLYNGAANDLPMLWLGFAASPDYIRSAANGLSADTTLGRNARAIAPTL